MITQSEDGSKQFFHFPINLLHRRTELTATEKKSILADVLRYVLFSVAEEIGSNRDEQEITAAAKEYMAGHPHLPRKNYSLAECKYLAAWKFVGGDIGHYDFDDAARVHRRAVKCSFGQSRVSLNREYFVQCLKGAAQLDWREFSILCAVYGALGRDPARCIRYERLSAMALGFSSEREFDEYNNYLVRKLRLTYKQTRSTVAALEQRNFFLTASPNGRHKFYTTQLRPLPRLAQWLASREIKRDALTAQPERTKTNAVKEAIAEAKKRAASGQVEGNSKAT